MEYEIGGEQIIVRTAIPFLSILGLEICHRENAHENLEIRAIVKEVEEENILNTDWSDTKILVIKKNEEDRPLFYGVIKTFICKKENKLLVLEITGLGETIVLDREKKKRSFQNQQMTYKQLVGEVLKNYDNFNFIWNTAEDRIIGTPIVQYEETDWEFLRRICSHFNGRMFTEWKAGIQNIFFDMNHGKEKNADKVEILEWGFDMSYYQNGCYENGISRNRAFYLEVNAKENWQIGDYVLYQNQRYHVYRRNITFKDGEISFHYRMGTEGMCYQKRMYNECLVGMRLEGTIKKTENESVYIQLDIDQQNCSDYPWAWVPETNNFCYCMPEVETKATLYFPTKQEVDGQVVLAVVKNKKNEKCVNGQYREFVTGNHKKIGLYPKRMFLEGMDGLVKFCMADVSGIQMVSNANISLVAEGKVYIEGKTVSVTAPIEVVCRTERANIEICRDFNFYAPGGVRTIGTGKVSEEKQVSCNENNRYADKKVEHWQASYSAIAAVPTVDFGKMTEVDSAIDIFACGSVPKVAKGATTIAMAEVMEGKKEGETSFPKVFESMNNYTVKGGYALPEKFE